MLMLLPCDDSHAGRVLIVNRVGSGIVKPVASVASVLSTGAWLAGSRSSGWQKRTDLLTTSGGTLAGLQQGFSRASAGPDDDDDDRQDEQGEWP
jgi:hypothetical protein